MHLNSNMDPRRFLDSNGFSTNPQREAALRYGPPTVWGTPDKQVLQNKDTNIDYSQQYLMDQGDVKGNIRAISPMQNTKIQAPSSPYSSNSPFKKITGIKKTPNGKQNSFHQHHGSSLIGQNNGGNVVITNSNFYNNSQETTLNTTDASFSQFLNQTANRSILPVDLSNMSQQQQNPLSQRQTRQAASMHSQVQMGYKSPQNNHLTRVIQGGLANMKGTPNNNTQKSGFGTYTPTYHQTVQNKQHHSVYTSPINTTNPHDNSQFLNDSELVGTPTPQSNRQYPTPYHRNKSTHINRDQSGAFLYSNILNDSQNHVNTTQGSVYQVDDSNENVRLNTMTSNRGHNKNLSCYTPTSMNTQANHNNSVHNNSYYDNFTNATTKQINQIENFFSNPRQQYSQNLNTTMGHNTSTSLTPTYRQNNSGIITPRQMPTNIPANQERIQNTLNGQIQQIPLNNQFNNSVGNNHNFGNSLNTPTNHKHQKSCFQVFEYTNNEQPSQQPQYAYNVEQSIPNSGSGHAKSHSLHQQRSTQSFHTSGGSVNQSNFLQNSSFINHIQNKQYDSKSTFNPSSNFGSIAQNKSGFLNSQSSFLNSNGAFLIPTNSGSSNNSIQGNQNNSTNQYIQNNKGGQINANATINGMLGQQFQQGNVLSKGPQLQKIIDDLKENIVKDLESLTSKLYKESESIINSSGNQINTNTYESIPTLPIQLAEFNIGDDKKIRFSFSGREVIAQITSTNNKLKRDLNENKENIISTYTTPLNSSQFLSPHQQQMLSEQIISSGIGKMGMYTPKSTNKNNDSSTALHTFSSPQSVEESASSSTPHSSKNKQNQVIPTHSPNNIKRPNIFNNPSKLFEKGQKDKNNSSFLNSNYGDQEETPTSRDENNTSSNNSKLMNFEESVRITYAQQSQGEEKLFEEFFKNSETQESRQSIRQGQQNKDQNTAQMMVPEVEKKQAPVNNSQIANKLNTPVAINQQKEKILFSQPIIANEIQKQQDQNQANSTIQTKPLSPTQTEKDNSEQKSQLGELNTANTPQKKESKVMNTEESENAPGKQTPCFQSSKSKNSNKNAIKQKTQSDEKNPSGLTPFCLKFDNVKQSQKAQQSIPELNGIDKQESKQSSSSQQQISSKTTLMRSNIMEEQQYEDELQSLTQNMSIQNKSDNLSDQDDVVLRTDNTDQLSEGSPKLCLYSSNRKSLSKKNQNDSSANKLPLSQFESQLEHIHEKDCESGNSTPNTQQQGQDQEDKKKKSQFQEYFNSNSSGNLLKEEQQPPVMKSSQTIINNNSLNGKQVLPENNYLNNSSNSSMLQAAPSKMEQSIVQDHCTYRGSTKSNHSSSSSSAQNRYQDSALSSRKQSFIENNNDSSYLNNSHIHNNNNSFTSTPGSNLKSSRYQQNAFYTPNNNMNNASLRNKKLDDSSNGLQNNNTFNINSNNGNSLLANNNHSNSATNLLNGTNIRFSTYLKHHEETKSHQPQNQGLVIDNKNFSNNSNTNNNLNLSNYSSQPRTNANIQTTSPASNTNVTPRQFLFKNKSNLSLFQEYEAKMKTPTKQGQIDLNLSQNSINGNTNTQANVKPNTPSTSKLHFNAAQMNKLQEEKLRRLDNNGDEVYTSRENPLEQIRENTNNTQENEDSQFMAFQNPHSTLTSDSKKVSYLDNCSSLLKPTISPELQMKKDPPRPLLIESESSKSNFFNVPNSAMKGIDKKDLFYTPLHVKNDNINNTNSKRDESSSVSSYQKSQPTSSPYYISSRSNFYESTQKLIEDSVIIQNKKNDLSSGNISKYSYSSSHSKSNNNSSNNNNTSSCSNQEEASKRSESSRILRNPIDLDDDDDDAILNLEDNDNNILNNEYIQPSKNNSQKGIQFEENSTPEKIKKSSPHSNHDESAHQTPAIALNEAQKYDSTNNNNKTNIISNFESQSIISEIQDKKKPLLIEEDTPSSTVLFNDNSDSTQKKRAQFTFNIPNQQSSEAIDICRNLKQEIDQEYQFGEGFERKITNQIDLVKESSDLSSSSNNTPTQQQSQQTLHHSNTAPSLQLNKNTSLEREIQKQNPYGMKEFTFSANSSSQSLNTIPESNTIPTFSKSQSHQSLNNQITSSIQVEDQNGCEITVSIVSNKRSSINQSKTILKKSLMGSPTSSALAKASSVKKSQRRISFKDKIEEVYNFEPDNNNRSTSRSPMSNKLPRGQPRFNIKKEPYFDSLKKFPNIQKDPSLTQQYKNKNPSNSSWNLIDKPETSGNTTPQNISSTQSNNTNEETRKVPSYLISRRESQLSNIEDYSNTRPTKPFVFTPSSTGSQKKQQKITFLEYSKINKKNE